MLPDGPLASGTVPTSRATLLLAVHSWPNAEGRRKRRVIRQLCRAGDAHVLRFIAMVPPSKGGASAAGSKRTGGDAVGGQSAAAASDSDDEADILRFDIGAPGKTKLLQKYLIANAFLRYASGLSQFDFVGRSEDDALVDVSSLAAHLASLRPRVDDPLLYGVRGEWVMWSPSTMTPVLAAAYALDPTHPTQSSGLNAPSRCMQVCWAQTLRRWSVQRTRDSLSAAAAAAARAGSNRRRVNGTAVNAPAVNGECRAEYMGPSLLVKGPLVVYSRGLLRELVAFPAFAADESAVRSDWKNVLRVRRETDHQSQSQ